MASLPLLRNSIHPLSLGAIHAMNPKRVPARPTKTMKNSFNMDISYQMGSRISLSMMRTGTLIHHIELRPGQGPKLVRSSGSVAKIFSQPGSLSRRCQIKLPSGEKKLIDTRCRAIIGQMSNAEQGKKKLRKAGQNRWLGIRPKVRGVAMNAVDHPHGGGEGKSNSAVSLGRRRRLRTPWRKPSAIQENIGNSGRTEEMEEQLDKSAALSHDETALQVHSLEKKGFEVSGFTGTDSETVLNGKRVKYNDKSRDEGSDANCFRRPCHNSASALSTYIDHLEKTVVSIPSRQLTKPAATNKFFPDGRRKRLPWTDEETNTLEEGVTKFSTDMNKNIPWRKILEFGQNVFDGTRTPVDLKDKWRNMLTKER